MVLIRSWTIARASHLNIALDAGSAAGHLRSLVLRLFDDARRLREDPWYSPANEATILDLLGSTPVRAPRLVAADVEGREVGVPMLLTTRLPGRPPVQLQHPAAFVRQLAEELAVIHNVDAGTAALPTYAPYYPPEAAPTPTWSRRPDLWRQAIEAAQRPPGVRMEQLIHRDYHPGNTLWSRGRLTGVVDWATGCRGPRAIDVARARLNLAMTVGMPWPRTFLERYTAVASRRLEALPLWELVDCVDLLPDCSAPQTKREWRSWHGLEEHIADVLASL